MHTLEPYYNWRHYYISEEDPASPFYGKEYSDFEYSESIYDHYIDPQWDNIGSETLYLKIIYANYDLGIAFIEMIGEWNDCLHNDIMFLKRNVVEQMMDAGIHKFILIGENVLNFHYSDDSYYEEWFEEVLELGGYIVLLNFREHVLQEFKTGGIEQYFLSGAGFKKVNWRTDDPTKIAEMLDQFVQLKLGA
jgi:hypothetical protein